MKLGKGNRLASRVRDRIIRWRNETKAPTSQINPNPEPMRWRNPCVMLRFHGCYRRVGKIIAVLWCGRKALGWVRIRNDLGREVAQ